MKRLFLLNIIVTCALVLVGCTQEIDEQDYVKTSTGADIESSTIQNQNETNEDQVEINTGTNLKPIQTETEEEEVEWLTYRHDVLGFEFQYPSSWGNPRSYLTDSITHLDRLKTDRVDGGNKNLIEIHFDYNKDGPLIEIANDQYKQEQPVAINPCAKVTLYMREEGMKAEDICNIPSAGYQISPDCENHIRTFLISCTNASALATYSHSLINATSLKLQNGYYDSLYVAKNIERLLSEEDTTLEEMIHRSLEAGSDVNNERETFSRFAQSLKAFTPVETPEATLNTNPDEDPNITTIREHYFYIASHQLEKAYEMAKSKNVGFTQFQEWYKDTFRADITNIQNISPNRYQVDIELQDYNKSPEQYRVILEIDNNKIDTISSRRLFSEVTFNDSLSAHTDRGWDINAMVLIKNGIKHTIDTATTDFKDNSGEIPFGSFGNIRFSSSGKYLLYNEYGWEWGFGHIYDINNKQEKLELWNPFLFEFTPDEKYLYYCANNMLSGGRNIAIYDMENSELKHDFIADEDAKDDIYYMNIDCEYNPSANSLKYTLSQPSMLQEDEDTGKYSLTDKIQKSAEYFFDTDQLVENSPTIITGTQ